MVESAFVEGCRGAVPEIRTVSESLPGGIALPVDVDIGAVAEPGRAQPLVIIGHPSVGAGVQRTAFLVDVEHPDVAFHRSLPFGERVGAAVALAVDGLPVEVDMVCSETVPDRSPALREREDLEVGSAELLLGIPEVHGAVLVDSEAVHRYGIVPIVDILDGFTRA